jgi:hypothetical protein
MPDLVSLPERLRSVIILLLRHPSPAASPSRLFMASSAMSMPSLARCRFDRTTLESLGTPEPLVHSGACNA